MTKRARWVAWTGQTPLSGIKSTPGRDRVGEVGATTVIRSQRTGDLSRIRHLYCLHCLPLHPPSCFLAPWYPGRRPSALDAPRCQTQPTQQRASAR